MSSDTSDHTPKREIYLSSLPRRQAQTIWREACLHLALPSRLFKEKVPVEEALGRVTANSVFAQTSSPHYHAAAMDGIAICAADTIGATQTSPKRLRVGVEAFYINTGDPLPDGADAVIMIENIVEIESSLLEIRAAASPWQHTRLIGEDIVATDVVVPAHCRLRPVDLGTLLAAGVLEIEVHRKPLLAIIPTGGEIVSPGQARLPGQIPDFNSPMISAMLQEFGAIAECRRPVGDDLMALQQAIVSALAEVDMVLTIAGASAGNRDFTAEAIRRAGELLVHGVAIKPGKPVALGIVNNKPVIALPGYPISAMLCMDLFVLPTLALMLGIPTPQRPVIKALLGRKVASQVGSEEFLRLRMGDVDGDLVAIPMARGAGLVSSLSRADGYLPIPALSEGFEKGDKVYCELLRPEHETRNTILITGSHDIALDLLSDELRTSDSELSVASTHLGSMGGLASLREGLCHLAGTHLLDPDTGEYNWPYLRQLFRGEDIILVTLAHRQQGFIVPPGNPKNIKSWEDLTRPDITFINRQAGAGTRVLLDAQLRARCLAPNDVQGYRREVYTHLAVAAMVENGTADVGLGILAAARARKQDFLPLALERYDLAMRPEVWDSRIGEALRHALNSAQFREKLNYLGGYDARETGRLQQPPGR